MKQRLNVPTLIKIIKIAAGSCLAIIIAQLAGVQYSASAGIITLLSIQDTKKATLEVAAKRTAAFVTAVIIAYGCFMALGFHPYAFGVFLLFFVAVCIGTGIQDGISMCAVLVTHFLVEKSMSTEWIKNEAMLMLIGTGIGILLNLYMPRYVNQIRTRQVAIEMEMRLILKGIATFLTDQQAQFELSYDFSHIEAETEAALRQAYADNDNILRYELRYFIQYMEMRKSQIVVLKHIMDQVAGMSSRPVQSIRVAALIDDILLSLRESNNARRLLENLHQMKIQFKESPLPKDRQEFEDRAILYSLINSLEQFLEFKKYFALNLTEQEKKTFWTE